MTVVGIITILLSLYGLFTKTDKFLLWLTAFTSVFTATAAYNGFTSFFLFDVAIVTLTLRFLLDRIKNKTLKNLPKDFKNFIKKNSLTKILLIFAATLIISCFITKNFGGFDFVDFDGTKQVAAFSKYNLTQTLHALEMIYLSLILLARLKTKDDLKIIIHGFAAAACFAIFWGLFQFIIEYFDIAYPHEIFNNADVFSQLYEQIHPSGVRRVNSIMTEPSTFSMLLNTFLPLIVSFSIFKKHENKSTKVQYILLAVLTVSTMFLTTSSTSYLGVIVFLFFSAFYLFFRSEKQGTLNKNRLKTLSKIIFILVVGYAFTQILYLVVPALTSKTLGGSLSDTFLQGTVGKMGSESGADRFGGAVTALTIFLKHPLFGSGLGTYRSFDIFTNLLCNTGLVGFSIYFLILLFCFESLTKIKHKNEPLYFALLGSLLMIFISGVSIPDINNLYVWVLLVVIFKTGELTSYNHKFTFKNHKLHGAKIGIEARSVITEKRSGIGNYTYEIIKYINDHPDGNEYYLYSNKPLVFDFKLKPHMHERIEKSSHGAMWYIYRSPKLLWRDEIDIFFGPNFMLPEKNEFTKNIKTIVTIHDLAILRFKHAGKFRTKVLVNIYGRIAAKTADKILTVSDASKSDIVNFFHVSKNKIETTYLAAPSASKIKKSDAEEILKKLKLKKQDYFFFLSTLEPRKNVDTIIKAYELYRTQNPKSKAKLVLAGGLGWKYQDTLKLIENSKFTQDILRPGYISDAEKTALYENSLALVFPSLFEGFGLPILEAFVNNTLVITAKNSSLTEVGGNVAYYIDEATDEKSLSEKMEIIANLTQKERTKKLDAGNTHAKKFNWQTTVESTLHALSKTVEQ